MSNQAGTGDGTRDPSLDAAWHAASTEEPTPQVDASILAAAHEETRSRSQSRSARRASPRWIRWQSLAAAAGLAGLAFLVVQRMPTGTESTKTFESPAPSLPAAGIRPEADNAAGAVSTAETQVPQLVQEPPRSSAPVSSEARPPQPGEEAFRKAAPADRPTTQGRAEDLAVAPLLESPTPLVRQQAAGIAAEEPASDAPSPDVWVRRILALHEAGDLPAAAYELRAFRRAYPDADARLPTALHEWANTVVSGVER